MDNCMLHTRQNDRSQLDHNRCNRHNSSSSFSRRDEKPNQIDLVSEGCCTEIAFVHQIAMDKEQAKVEQNHKF